MISLCDYFKPKKNTIRHSNQISLEINADISAQLVKNEIRKIEKVTQSLENVINEMLIENDRYRKKRS